MPVKTAIQISPLESTILGSVSGQETATKLNAIVTPSSSTITGKVVLTNQQIISSTDSTFVFASDGSVDEVIISETGIALTTITVPSTVSAPKIITEDILVTEGDGSKSITFTNGFTIDASTSNVDIDVVLPDGIKIVGPSTWDGKINLPTFKPTSTVNVDSGIVTSVIEIGAGDTLLTFDKPAQLKFEGKGGQNVLFTRSGITTEVTTTCTGNTLSDNTGLPAGGDCKITVGNNLYVWTKHFTLVSTSSSSGGGGGGPGAKPELLSLSFSNISTGILEADKLASFEVGEEVDVELSFYESFGLGMEHVELYSNSGHDLISNSDFWIEYDRYKPLVVHDPTLFLMEEPQVRAINEGTQTDVSFGLKIGKTLPESDIIIKAWDSKRNPIEIRFENAWEIVASTTSKSEVIMDPEPTIDPEPSFSWEIFNKWAGYSTETATDSDFLSHLGYDGEKIPYWFKKNNAKWLKDGLISQEDIINATEFLVEQGIIKV